MNNLKSFEIALSSIREMVQDLIKPHRFGRGNDRHRQKKVHFILAFLKLVYILVTTNPTRHEGETVAKMLQIAFELR